MSGRAIRRPPLTNTCRGKSTCSRASRATARRISACRKLLPERGLEFLVEFHELVGIDIADRPEIEAVLAAARTLKPCRLSITALRWPEPGAGAQNRLMKCTRRR